MGKRLDSFRTRRVLKTSEGKYTYYSLKAFSKAKGVDLSEIPYSHKILLENLLRHEDGKIVTQEDILALVERDPGEGKGYEIQFMPGRVLLQDFTGVPAVVDLAAVRSALVLLEGDPGKVNPNIPVDLVIDHSIQVDTFGTAFAFLLNENAEVRENAQRERLM